MRIPQPNYCHNLQYTLP